MASARGSTEGVEARRPRHHRGAKRRDAEPRPAAPGEVPNPLPRPPDVHDTAEDAAVAVDRLPRPRTISVAIPLASLRRQSLLLRRRRERRYQIVSVRTSVVVL